MMWGESTTRRRLVRLLMTDRQDSTLTFAARTADERLPDALQFMQLLWALVHGLDRTSKRMIKDIGVTGPQRLVLRVVGLFPGLSAGELATVLHVHPSTLTGVLQRLVAQRLLTRSRAPHDQRRAVLHLAPLGVRINSAHRGTVESAIAQALRGIGARDRAATKRVLARLTQHLESAGTITRFSRGR